MFWKNVAMLEQLWSSLAVEDPLYSFREKAWHKFQKLGLPDRKNEAFQYVRKWDHSFQKLAHKQKDTPGRTENCLVFVDGFFAAEASHVMSPIVCQPLASALSSYGVFIQNRLHKTIAEETDPFAALNGALQGEGIFLYVPPKCKAALHLHHICTQPGLASPRIHLYLGRHSEVRLVQNSEGSALSNTFIDVSLDEDAKLTFRDHHKGTFQALRATLKKNSSLQTVFLGNVLRSSVKIQLCEEASTAQLLGLARPSREEEIHFHTLIEHIAPHTSSRQHIKSVLEGKSCFSFEGKILVQPEAQKTVSYQLNNNLLLSDDATANAKPNLEIFADDVKASHGATFGKLDEEHIFYLRSRGLTLEEAKKWLIEAFCKEILDAK